MTAPQRVDALSTADKMVLQWAAPATTDSPGGDVIGYRLEVDDGLGSDFSIVYDSANTPSLTQLVLGGSNGLHSIVPGRPYRMRLTGRAFNGLAAASDIVTIYSCELPSGLEPPLLQSIAGTDMTLGWSEPSGKGSCPLLGYAIYVDDGSSGDAN